MLNLVESLFQSILYTLGTLFPIAGDLHLQFLKQALGWELPHGQFMGLLNFWVFVALFVYYLHEWASLISSFLQVVLFRKRPMTLDERMPFFIFLSTVPFVVGRHYLLPTLPSFLTEIEDHYYLWLVLYALAPALVVFLDSISRRTKDLYDWNLIDAFLLSFALYLSLLPGMGLILAALTGGIFRNYRREPALKYAMLVITPLIAFDAFSQIGPIDWHSNTPLPHANWLIVIVCSIVALTTCLITLGYTTKSLPSLGFKGIWIYRIGSAFCLAFWHWWSQRG